MKWFMVLLPMMLLQLVVMQSQLSTLHTKIIADDVDVAKVVNVAAEVVAVHVAGGEVDAGVTVPQVFAIEVADGPTTVAAEGIDVVADGDTVVGNDVVVVVVSIVQAVITVDLLVLMMLQLLMVKSMLLLL